MLRHSHTQEQKETNRQTTDTHVILYYHTDNFLSARICWYHPIKEFTYFLKKKKKLQEKESGFINELVTESDLKHSHYFQTDDFIENHTFIFGEPKNIENDKLARNEVRDFIFEMINGMSDEKMRQLFKNLKSRQHKEQRKYSRKDFLMITDYIVGDRYYRDFIQDISASGVFIKTSQKFSVGQSILMTFMSPDNQKPF